MKFEEGPGMCPPPWGLGGWGVGGGGSSPRRYLNLMLSGGHRM